MPHFPDFGNNGSIVKAMTEGIYDDEPEDTAEVHRRRRRLWPLRRRALLITSARRSPAENRRHREKVYFAIQIARVPLLVLSGLALFWWQNWPVAVLLFAVSIPLPAVAVILANEKGEKRDKRTANVYKPALLRELAAQEELDNARQAQLEQASGRAKDEPEGEPETIDAEEDPDDRRDPRPDAR